MSSIGAKAMDFGAFDFISKPFDIVELRHKVKKALENLAQKTQSPH